MSMSTSTKAATVDTPMPASSNFSCQFCAKSYSMEHHKKKHERNHHFKDWQAVRREDKAGKKAKKQAKKAQKEGDLAKISN